MVQFMKTKEGNEIEMEKINSKKDTRKSNIIRNSKGITLIALVITIVILLILAGISISSLTVNGLFNKAEDAKIITRAASVEEQIALWKSENFASDYTNDEKVSTEKMLEDLKSKKLVYEEEINRDNEVIIIKKKDETVVKEISYAVKKNSKVKFKIISDEDNPTAFTEYEVEEGTIWETFINKNFPKYTWLYVIKNGEIGKYYNDVNMTVFYDPLIFKDEEGNIKKVTIYEKIENKDYISSRKIANQIGGSMNQDYLSYLGY